MNKLKASEEFTVGKHSIGYVSSTLTSHFGSADFEMNGVPTFQKLPRRMKDAEIEGELKPGLCTLGDLLAFLDNAPDECKDGNWNLFYFEPFVVVVRWRGDEWGVGTWRRDDNEWFGGLRVFSPATGPSVSMASAPSETQGLSAPAIKDMRVVEAIAVVEQSGKRWILLEEKWYVEL